ncbi:hypothetical protein DFP73DRAFT_561688 [Morchella snyderi]|nr:hypothetical protein DFP73DRAFT_561688 [Morchella snyderi]
MPSTRKRPTNNYRTTIRRKRMHEAPPRQAQEYECGHIETDRCWCAIPADKPVGGGRRNVQEFTSLGETISLDASDTKRLCVLVHHFNHSLKKVSLETPVYACRRGWGGWDLVDNCNTTGGSIDWLPEVMASMVLYRQGIMISPVDAGSGAPVSIDRDPFARMPRLEPVSRPCRVPRGTVDIRKGTFNDRSRVGSAWFAYGFIPAFFKMLSFGSVEDRAMLANVMKAPAQQRKQCVYTLLRMAVSSELDDLDAIDPDVGDASQQLPSSTDYESAPHTPMDIDIDIASPSEGTDSDSAVAYIYDSTTHQQSAPPDLTQRHERQPSEDSDGEERTHCGGGEHEDISTHPVGDNIVVAEVPWGGASLPAPKPPGSLTTNTSTVDLYNRLVPESELEKLTKLVLSVQKQQEKYGESLKAHGIQLVDQDVQLKAHDAKFGSFQVDIGQIMSMLGKRQKEEDERKAWKEEKEKRRQRHEEKQGKAIEMLVKHMEILLQDRNGPTPTDSGHPAAPACSCNMPPAQPEAGPSNRSGPPPPPADRNQRAHVHITRSVSRAGHARLAPY